MPLLALQPPYEESKNPYRYTKLSESCKQVKIIKQNHILGQKHVDKTSLQNTLLTGALNSGDSLKPCFLYASI